MNEYTYTDARSDDSREEFGCAVLVLCLFAALVIVVSNRHDVTACRTRFQHAATAADSLAIVREFHCELTKGGK